METQGVLGEACTPRQRFSALSLKLQYEQQTMFQCQYHSWCNKVLLKGASSVRIYILSKMDVHCCFSSDTI